MLKNKTEILTPDSTYHIYNRANGSEKLFINEKNYNYFLEKYKEYISPIADTFCYCLMPNHFHLLIRIKSENDVRGFFHQDLQGFKKLEGLISKQFSNFFNAYAKAFNKSHHRKGNLFMHTYKRKLVTDIEYLRVLVRYIHLNPTESRISKKISGWKHSSYSQIVEEKSTFLNYKEVIGWFDDVKTFIAFHAHFSSSS